MRNQILVKTVTGIWQITYNGENRPIRWEQNDQSEQSTNRTIITISYDRMGRRVTKNDQRFVYNGYLQIANFNCSPSPCPICSVDYAPGEVRTFFKHKASDMDPADWAKELDGGVWGHVVRRICCVVQKKELKNVRKILDLCGDADWIGYHDFNGDKCCRF